MNEVKELTEREKMACDVICAAVEGGTGYWAYCVEYDHGSEGLEQVRPATATLEEMEGHGGTVKLKAVTVKLTVDSVLAAMVKVRDDASVGVRSDTRGIVAEALATNYAGDVDADVADAIVQAQAFGTLIYG